MKKKSTVAMLTIAAMMGVVFTGCGERTDIENETVIVREEEPQTDALGDSADSEAYSESSVVPETTVYVPPQEESAEEMSGVENTADSEEGSTQEPAEPKETKTAAQLTEGERKARREQQNNFVEARQLLYGLPNSKDKTSKINQMDRQILANNAYDFSKKKIVFIGDSVTEGITSAVDTNGNFVSYVTYVNSYLHFNKVLNNGVGGRMFADYGGDQLSLAMNFDNVTSVEADVIVVFAGVNDYLSTPPDKRFGNVDDKLSTAGYCGAVRNFMNRLQIYYGDRDIFFVTMYNNSKKVESAYSDIEGQPTLNDYLEVQRKLAREYGFHVIELYDIGFMDCSDQESSDFYLRDNLHPKDNGNIVLGEHIAAELSLYFGEKEVD